MVGIATAFLLYGRPSNIPVALSRTFRPLFELSQNKWYFDEIYDAVFTRPMIFLSFILWREVDKGVIDMVVNGVASSCQSMGASLRRLQTGQLQNYALVMALGLFGMVSIFLFMK